MKLKVGLIDYGMGNLHSVAKALASQGAAVRISNKPSVLKKADLLVLPGVGAFGAAMKSLRKNKLDRFVVDWIKKGRPYLGICLGFQLLFDRSEESPKVKGLGVFSGPVVGFPKRAYHKKSMAVPHMGWNTIRQKTKAGASFFKGIRPDDAFYFVHSFYPAPKKKNVVLTETGYGKNFCSAVYGKNLFASQFHPEKSGDVGLRLLKNVVQMARRAA